MKRVSKKFLYIVSILALLALMVPAMAMPVAAASNSITSMTIVYGSDRIPDGADDVAGHIRAYNISGTIIEVTSADNVTAWELHNISVGEPGAPAEWVGANPNTIVPIPNVVQVRGVYGEASIIAHYADNTTDWVNKKWGLMTDTEFEDNASVTTLIWSEINKAFYGQGTITDTVNGTIIENGGIQPHVLQGAILNWYLLSAEDCEGICPMTGSAASLKDYLSGLPHAQYTQFIDETDVNFDQWDPTTWMGTEYTNVTGYWGSASVNIAAWYPEVVRVVVVPEYPNDPNREVFTECAYYNFVTDEYVIVPQVRWAGEKIVLEANFGVGMEGDVNFYLEGQSVGTLEGIDDDQEAATVWTEVDPVTGIAAVILTSNVAGQADVQAAYYPNGEDEAQTNQYTFRVYFLNFYSLTLGDVVGKRDGHNCGLWTPENPFNTNFPDNASDMEYQKLNVSQDALERAQVKGWFMPSGAYTSSRPAVEIDLNGNGIADDMVVAPYGHYVLPDDWAFLAGGGTQWKKYVPQWDIMDSPDPADDSIASLDDPLGDFRTEFGTGTLVGPAPTIGPFAPGIEVMTTTGWVVDNYMPDTYTIPGTTIMPRQINTVVPNGKLDAWDAPMPPAKITFEVIDNNGEDSAGFFKETLKTQIYYMGEVGDIAYTSPFYFILVPAHQSIPAFNADGSKYDWDSFNGVSGPYEFWKIINRPQLTDAPGDASHPTSVQVYSDNHGEAMAYLNGDWNIDLSGWMDEGYDVEPGATVGSSLVMATAQYPYKRLDQIIMSNVVEKEWTWGGVILGMENNYPYPSGNMDPSWFRMVLATGALPPQSTWVGEYPYQSADAEKRMVWVWVSDRDAMLAGANGSLVTWTLYSSTGARIPDITSASISSYNPTTMGIGIQNGFLPGTKRLLNPMNPNSFHNDTWTIGYAKTVPVMDSDVADLFNKFYGTQVNPSTMEPYDPEDFSVAAIEVTASDNAFVEVEANITIPGQGQILRVANLDFTVKERMDDPIAFGDANLDGDVNMADVVTVERIILGQAPRVTDANAYWNTNSDGSMIIDMADVLRIENIILTSN